MTKKLTVELLLTGNEIMSGDVVDSNSAMISQQLSLLGLEVSRRVTVKDNLSLLTEEIISQSRRADILIINGGLGPTIDDMTAQALAGAANTALVVHPLALEQLSQWCEKRGYPLNQANKKQAILPQGCDIIDNKTGSAPGFIVQLNGCAIYTTPGVPHELRTMLSEQISPIISQTFDLSSTTDVTKFQVFGIGESTIQERVSNQLADWPDDIELGFRAAMPLIEIKLTTDSEQGHRNKAHWQHKVKQLLGGHVVGDNKTSLGKALVTALAEKNKTVTFAESCTGGLMSSLITEVAGSSGVFHAGFVTYSNQIKSKVIGVAPQTLLDHGAVSEQVVLEMAQGALSMSESDYVVAVSGIAGPSGGSDDKPVGTVWLAWGDNSKMHSLGLCIAMPRRAFQQYVASVGLDLIRRLVLNINDIPYYVVQRQIK